MTVGTYVGILPNVSGISTSVGSSSGGSYVSVGYPSSFLPTSLSGLQWWLRADLGVTLVSGKVSAWADQSGIGDANRNATQSTAGQRPTYNASDSSFNNQATLSFSNAADSSLQTGTWSPSISDPYTLFVVGSDTNDGNEEFMLAVSGTFRSLLLISNYIIEGNADLFSTTARNTSNHIFVLEINNTASTIRINQVTPQATGTIAGHFAMTTCTVGAYITTGFSLQGKLAEIALVDHILSAGDMSKMLNYLGSRYNITIGA